MKGISKPVAEVIKDMPANKEAIPEPMSKGFDPSRWFPEKRYSIDGESASVPINLIPILLILGMKFRFCFFSDKPIRQTGEDAFISKSKPIVPCIIKEHIPGSGDFYDAFYEIRS